MAGQILKDPYNFSFLTLEPQVQALDVERQLTEHITKFLPELGPNNEIHSNHSC